MTIIFKYDANGNRSSRTVNGVTENYAYDSADKLTGITGGARPRTFGYDLAGRTTSIVESAGTTTLNYDYDGRVTSIGYIGGGSDAFTYNGSGARVTSSGTNGNKSFRRNGVGVTSPLLSDGTKTYTPGVSSRESGVSTFQHSGLKNATDQTSASQSVTASRHYDAFGNLISSSGTWQGTHGYGGGVGYQEDASGLKLLGHRYYDSDTGRFLSQDPVGDGRNWYAYCRNSPLASVDASGLWATGSYCGDVGAVFVGYGRAIAGVAVGMKELITGEYAAKVAAAVDEDGQGLTLVDLAAGFWHSNTGWWGSTDPTEFGEYFGNALITVGTAGAGFTESAAGATGAITRGGGIGRGGGTSTFIEKVRPTLGRDGATSKMLIEKSPDGKTISRTHQVTLDGEVIHQHQTHIGKHGSEKEFPDDWVQYPRINIK